MADTATIASNTSGIAASSSARAAWDRAYHEHERLCLLRDAYMDFGPLAAVNIEWDRTVEKISAEYGSDRCPAARKVRAKAMKLARPRLDAEYARYAERADAATVAMLDLMRIPAPDIQAVQTKYEIVHNDFNDTGEYKEELWQAIEADLRRMVWEKP